MFHKTDFLKALFFLSFIFFISCTSALASNGSAGNIYAKSMKVLKNVISESDGNRLQSTERLAFKENQKVINKTMISGIVGFFAAILIVVFFIYLILNYVSSKREAMLIEQQERILDLMQDQNVALASGQAKLILGKPSTVENNTITAREMLQDSNPHVRARGVEVIEAELIKEMDFEVAIKLLMPFLKDSDNRVKANAAKAIYSFDRSIAIETLKEMSKNPDKWMRVSAAWVFGEIGTDYIIDPLIELASDLDYHVKRRAIKSLEEILQVKKDFMNEDIKKKIVGILES